MGQNDGVIVNCYNQGAITGSTYVGGIVGYNNKACMCNVYSSGTVIGTNNYAGSLIGGSIDDIIQYAYFLIGSATDGANQMQTGVGTEQLGYFSELDEDVFSVFDEDGNVSQTQINQQIVENFVWALNLGRQVFDIEEPETLVLWSQTSTTFPVLQEEGVWNSVTFCTFEGHGTKLNPFLIRDAVELYYFSIYVNMGNSFEGQYFRMEYDIQYDTR